jgi:murein L,D-transpeptidase YafK
MREFRIAAMSAGDLSFDAKWRPLLAMIVLAAALAISAWTSADAQDAATKATTYEPRLGTIEFSAGFPLFIRIFKQEAQLELWMQKAGRFELLDSFPICHWSGTLGPKLYEGDRQAPEGFYSVGPQQLVLSGRHIRSLDLGYPNAFDRSLGRTGSHILLHGGCRSTGCFAMTDPVMERVYALAEQALHAGQQEIPIHVFPFRMTIANLEQHSNSPWRAFWSNLKVGYDAFEATRTLPVVYACRSAYLVEGDDPTRQTKPPDDCAVQTPLMAEAKSKQRIARAPLRPATVASSARAAVVRPRVAAMTYPRDNVAECNRLWKPATGTTRQDWLTICKRLDFQQRPAIRMARRPF